MIYTCYDMVRDCRADRPAGWFYFLSQYVPVIRKVAAHYFPERAGGQEWMVSLLVALRRPESSVFQSLEPSPERWFVAELRQTVLALQPAPALDDIDLPGLSMALEPLTVTEKQAVWLETMRYGPAEAGVLLRMDPRTVDKIRDKAAERLRGSMDTWRRSLLADNGLALGRAAAEARTPQCLPVKAFLDVLDGRTTWRGREELERHVAACWHCIDHFCRMAEVIELLRGVTPLSDAETEPFRQALGLGRREQPGWKRWFGKASGGM